MTKPVIFISYSHKDEPDKPRDDEVAWLSFVMRFLQPDIKSGTYELWVDQHMIGGTDWDPEIERKLRECDIFILLVSAHSMASDYIVDKEIAIIRERQANGENVHFYPLLLTPTPNAGLNKVKDKNLRPRDTRPFSSLSHHDRMQHMTDAANEIAEITAGIVSRKPEPPPRQPQPGFVHITGLPETPYEHLVGRGAELKRLDDAWTDPMTNILSLIAEGGAGKSALVNEWIKRMQAENYRGAEMVLGWSFYSQGTKERAASADQFLNWALERLGIVIETTNATAKGEAIAEALMNRRILLVLDGVEPLQHGPDRQLGQLKDPGLRALLRRFAATPPAEAHGMITLTSRLPIKDIDRWKDGAAPIVDLERLSDDAGAALLRDNGIWGTDKESIQAAREFGGHPLALGLLASFLKETQKGDIRRRDHIRAFLDDKDNPRHDHAIRVMESYEKEWLAGKPVLLMIMYMVGLFDRPANDACLRVLRDEPLIFGLFTVVPDAEWNRSVSRLREVRLLAPTDPSSADSLDTHPLVREWFGERYRQVEPEGWQLAHGRLYEHLRDTTLEGNTPTLEDLTPLYQAISHGCRAGHHSETLDEIYRERICRRVPNQNLEYYAVTKLGAVGSDLAALAWFFEKPYEIVVTTLNKPDRTTVQRLASDRLRMQGRLTEALLTQHEQLDCLWTAYDLTNSSNASTKSLLLLLINVIRQQIAVGHLADADRNASRTVQLANRLSSTASYKSAVSGAHVRKAEVLFEIGDISAAERQFVSAEQHPLSMGFKYALPYTYNELLLAKAEWTKAYDRAVSALKAAKRSGNILQIGRATLTLCRSRLGTALELSVASKTDRRTPQLSTLRNEFNESNRYLQASENATAIPSGLLARAAYRRAVGDWNGAARDLDEVEEIAEPGPMRLYLCDMALERARLAFAKIEAFAPLNGLFDNSPPKPTLPNDAQHKSLHDDAAKQLAIAADYIEKCDYHRRDEELAELQAVLRGEKKFADLPPRV